MCLKSCSNLSMGIYIIRAFSIEVKNWILMTNGSSIPCSPGLVKPSEKFSLEDIPIH